MALEYFLRSVSYRFASQPEALPGRERSFRGQVPAVGGPRPLGLLFVHGHSERVTLCLVLPQCRPLNNGPTGHPNLQKSEQKHSKFTFSWFLNFILYFKAVCVCMYTCVHGSQKLTLDVFFCCCPSLSMCPLTESVLHRFA